ncbi:hypothetical protein BH10ACT1_BH10ACT1_33390 [soil metagenome]
MVVPDPACGTDACRGLLQELALAADHRDAIGMAKGILMAGSRCSPDEAFALLRRASQRENVKLWEIAEKVVYDGAAADVTARSRDDRNETW